MAKKLALLIIPGGGQDRSPYFYMAEALRAKYYDSRSRIVEAWLDVGRVKDDGRWLLVPHRVPDQGDPRFQVYRKREDYGCGWVYFLDRVTEQEVFLGELGGPFDVVVVAMHATGIDGPNVAANVRLGGGLRPQPWHRVTIGDDRSGLCEEALRFWSRVGACLKSEGAILLLGCRGGQGHPSYAQLVANASRRVTASTVERMSSADRTSMEHLVSELEQGHPTGLIMSYVTEPPPQIPPVRDPSTQRPLAPQPMEPRPPGWNRRWPRG